MKSFAYTLDVSFLSTICSQLQQMMTAFEFLVKICTLSTVSLVGLSDSHKSDHRFQPKVYIINMNAGNGYLTLNITVLKRAR